MTLTKAQVSLLAPKVPLRAEKVLKARLKTAKALMKLLIFYSN